MIKLTGEVDMSNVDSLREVIEPVMESEPERVDFDLSGLEFMDSSGIALLLRVAATAQLVYLREPSTLVRRLVEARASPKCSGSNREGATRLREHARGRG